MIRTVLAVAALAVGVTVALAQDPIAARKATMKEVGAQARNGAQMMRGEAPFDLAKAKVIFATYASAAEKMPTLFPDNTKTGGETTAAPKIWEDKAGFAAGFAKLGKESKEAEASVKDLDSFKAAFGNVSKNCGACHETFRVKKG
jgi:cytochrome c556